MSDNIQYREKIYIPKELGKYENKLANALIDICFATSKSNFSPFVLPPGFTLQSEIKCKEPVSYQNVMIAHTIWNPNNKIGLICFTGTEYYSEWISDMEFSQIKPIPLNGYIDGILVHKGFYNIYNNVRTLLWDWWNINKNNIDTLFITGHSLGGALSTLCAFDFADLHPIHYSFASPRCGNVKFVDIFTQRVPQSLRINNTEDSIPQLPLAQTRNYTYKHTSGNIPFTSSLGSIILNHTKAYYNLP